ncbi:MAG: HEAT repeat domain-containing protein [Treponema sp.]|nr:HEAT repeat domain-containing protein [Treponema sp.]MCL2237000.1 HEAT repeat domain-containing protein [Treponema sp.]
MIKIRINFNTNRHRGIQGGKTFLEFSAGGDRASEGCKGLPRQIPPKFLRSVACCVCLFFININFIHLFAQQNTEESRRDILQFGTETEIASLIQSLIAENADYLDNDLIALVLNSRNQRILTSVFGYFGQREKTGLEARALRAITQREDETNETVHAAMDYLGRVKSAEAVPVIMELLDTEERRFLATGFRAIGLASSGNEELANQTAVFLVEYYEERDPASDLRSVILNSIGATRSAAGIALLVDIATNTDERIPLRIAALGALSNIGNERGLEAILTCIGTNDPNVRSAAVGALGPFTGENVDNAILDAFRDSYYRTRLAAAQAARDRRLAAAVPFLRFRAERDDVPNVKDEAIRALGAIANADAIQVLETLFTTRTNTDRVRILAADMLIKNAGGRHFTRVIAEMEDARTRNQQNLVNGFLRVAGEAVVEGDKAEIESVARRFMDSGNVMEKLFGLDMVLNNELRGLRDQLVTLARDRNESIARKARRIAERLNIEIPDA